MVALHNSEPRVSVIIPTLDEAGRVGALLAALRGMGECEIVVADGGSGDGTRDEAMPLADRIIDSPPGRARQMDAGAGQATGDVLWFVHADTAPPVDGLQLVRSAVAGGADWGRFDLRLDGRHPAFRVIERFINWRSALSGIATGDQAIFVTRAALREAGGWPDIALMEDVALSRTLKRRFRPARIRVPVTSSSRRWETHGILRTTWLMWRLRFAFWRGADPSRLAELYAPRRGPGR